MGLSIARRFGQEGYRLALLARRVESIAQSAKDLSASGIEAHSFAADAGDFVSLANAFEQIRQTLGDPDLLVYNVAALKVGNPLEITATDFVQDFRANVAGALVATQQVAGAIREQKQGTILFTGGGFAFEPAAAYASLAVGKAAIRNLCFSLAQALEPDNIHVATVTICGTIEPGTHFDPDSIAQTYWQLHTQDRGNWEREIIYK